MSKRSTIRIVSRTVIVALFVCAVFLPDAAYAADDTRTEIARIEREMMIEGDFAGAARELLSLLGDVREKGRIYLSLGLAYYGLMEYGEAARYFAEAKKEGVYGQAGELLERAVAVIEEEKDILDSMEKAARAVRAAGGTGEDTLTDNLTIWHFTVLSNRLSGKVSYTALVVPHVMWIKENAPGMEGMHRLSGDVYYSAMLYKQAEEDYKKAVEEDVGNPELYRMLADCQVALGDYDSAEENYSKAIDIYGRGREKEDAAEARRLKTVRRALPRRYKDIFDLTEKGQYREAEEICRKRISLNPGDYAAMVQLGRIYWERGKKRTAISLFRKVARRAPDYPTAHLFLGRAYFFEGKPRKGIAEFDVFKEKMELLPDLDEEATDAYVANLHYIAYMYSTQKQYDEAIAECRKIISMRPDDQRAHYNLAVCYYIQHNDRPRAYSELQKVIEIDEDTRMAGMAEYYIDYIRRNPNARVIGDFSFLYED